MLYVSRGATVLAAILVAVLVGATAASVVARYVFAAPFQWTEEFSGLMMVWIVFLGAISCEYRREHLTIDVVTARLPQKLRYVLAIVVGLASLGLLLTMAWLAYELAHSAMNKRTRIMGVSWFWIDIAATVGALGIAAILGSRLVRALTGREAFADESLGDTAPISENQAEPHA